MPLDKLGTPQPAVISTKEFRAGYDQIDFRARNSYCCECNSSIKKEDLKNKPENYIFYDDGHVAHKNGCNFN
jgi:hypothetical protein